MSFWGMSPPKQANGVCPLLGGSYTLERLHLNRIMGNANLPSPIELTFRFRSTFAFMLFTFRLVRANYSELCLSYMFRCNVSETGQAAKGVCHFGVDSLTSKLKAGCHELVSSFTSKRHCLLPRKTSKHFILPFISVHCLSHLPTIQHDWFVPVQLFGCTVHPVTNPLVPSDHSC